MRKVLIIDDSKSIRMRLGEMFKDLQFEVSDAEDGLEGVKLIETGFVPSIFLVDWNMPNMNGLEFIKNIRARDHLKAVPIVMVTTENEMSQVVTALEAGADEYIMKPFEEEALIEKLRIIGMDI